MEQQLTTGKIGRSLILFSLPMILGNLLQQLYNVADTLIVGQTIGATALSAVGSSYALMVLLTSIILGLCMGSSVVFAQLYGAKKIDDLKTSIFNSFVFILIISAIINVFAFALLDKFILWINIPSQAVALTRTYLKIIFIGMTFVSIYNFFASILRSIGNTVVPLIFLGVSALTNIILDLILILVFHLGVAGAALATVISQGLSAICITIYFFKKSKNLCPNKKHIHFNKRLLKLIINNSTLTAIQQSIMNLGILMVQGLVNSFGFATSAAFAAVVKIDAFAYMPAQDFGNAFSTFVAQNYGAKKSKRIKDGTFIAMIISSLFCLCSSALVYIFSKPLMLMFVNPGEHEIINIGIQYLHIEGVFYIGIGILFLLYGVFRGLGKSGISILLTVISLGSRVLLAYALSSISTIGVIGIWWSVPIGWALADIIGLLIYKKYK
ncbi:MAG: MATE family efflux transporter [Clostridium sp.]|nr:MATE family efflux transporter [Clostridium sp.]